MIKMKTEEQIKQRRERIIEHLMDMNLGPTELGSLAYRMLITKIKNEIKLLDWVLKDEN